MPDSANEGHTDMDSNDGVGDDPQESRGETDASDDGQYSRGLAAEAARAALGRVINQNRALNVGFAQSLLPTFNKLPLAQMLRSASRIRVPDTVFPPIQQQSLEWLSERIRGQHVSLLKELNPARTLMSNFEAQQRSIFAQFIQPSRIIGDLHRSIARQANVLSELPRMLLPPNLRPVSDDISFSDVLDFLEKEGIPLYLVPRASIGRRLVLAKDHSTRRKVLNDRFTDIVDDCANLLDTCTDPIVATEVHFIMDGIGALRAGHFASAQAIFTVTLDTLIANFYPDRGDRRKITNRKKDAPMPDELGDMSIRNAYVWLPVWNAHQEFWHHKGDRVPNDYSRHASVHAVSKTQFNKRNCVQSLMLGTSLVGYANQLAQGIRKSSNTTK
ncbi:hypothetical protein [Arthrobacter pigmenti]